MGNSAIGRGTAVEEYKVKASSGGTPDFLDGIVDGDSMTVVANQLVASGVQHEFGLGSRANTLAAGTQAITGLAFQPNFVMFMASPGANPAASWGWSDATDNYCLWNNHNESAETFQISFPYCIFSRMGLNVSNRAALTSFQSDGFTLTWTKQASPTGTTSFYYVAFKLT